MNTPPLILYAVSWRSGGRQHLIDVDTAALASIAAMQIESLPGNHDVLLTECSYDVDDAEYTRLKERMDWHFAKVWERAKSAHVGAAMREAAGEY